MTPASTDVLDLHYLMCAPDFYDVDYVINPWMEGNVHRSSKERAIAQWQGLYGRLKELAVVDLVLPQQGWPDMVFTANAGLVVERKVVLSRFLHPERQGEEPYFKEWFTSQGFEVFELPPELPFEGAGDALLDREGQWLWAGYGFRSELDAHPLIAKWLDVEVLSLRLIDSRFYHLDTCFCPLSRGYLLYYPPAFDSYSNRLIEMRVPVERRIAIAEADAINFACNAVNVGDTVLLNRISADLSQRLEAAGFEVRQTPLTEFLKAGGAAKCLTLRVTETLSPSHHDGVTIESRVIQMTGHLLDAGLINRALDVVVDAGGSFQVLEFRLGTQRHSTSQAKIRISAPSAAIMGTIMGQLIEIGAYLPEVQDAQLESVTLDGVAPDDFYVTNIFPTEVRIHGRWVRCDRQRMDGAIIVQSQDGEVAATCSLLRDLRVGDRVVVGVEGIRTAHRPEQREKKEEFSFMGAGVSSERRVELIVEQIAWELRQVRDRGGRTVVTAGPVVVHTGGAPHLAYLIREGYVQALLGGNAIAVHDLEQAMMGTSLGVDMQRGISVPGGHRHHLKVINTIRRYGSIAEAIKAGLATTGIMYECVHRDVPFVLAGSIRDDGPLPDTVMDLISAQQQYAELIRGADVILMLSSMLHSIGVGNMTPAGVKMVCVDINPAVVTKLADRGSIESVGVVTDVGLFLSLLVQQLQRLDSPLLTS
ncbi:MAG: TIGR00300 family protein [Oscillatoriales cyanobacterium SM2_2_1]|nr:TIGR00300 family protein [Oscillatoriales cyanobacterium SM2_2_1]